MCLPIPTVVTVSHLNPQQRKLARTIVRKQAAGFGIQVDIFGTWTDIDGIAGKDLLAMCALDLLPMRTTTRYVDGALKSTQRLSGNAAEWTHR